MHEADEQARRASIAIAELADEKAENDALKRRIRALEEEKDDLMEEVLALTGDE
jgi:predicted  nucleic acid-binding Zn-ribbon protein|tara:strand:+ start:10250 stop:10411 length:162 start_codon:yes stop_codon:yes gene_type:complete